MYNRYLKSWDKGEEKMGEGGSSGIQVDNGRGKAIKVVARVEDGETLVYFYGDDGRMIAKYSESTINHCREGVWIAIVPKRVYLSKENLQQIKDEVLGYENDGEEKEDKNYQTNQGS